MNESSQSPQVAIKFDALGNRLVIATSKSLEDRTLPDFSYLKSAYYTYLARQNNGRCSIDLF
ncbi:MAG: hypothetical protein NTV34_01975 [Proteobacteria bacterium]|nr:hypothetical protein [Pseudomonadota bacterium]